jgi:hypothetical protein
MTPPISEHVLVVDDDTRVRTALAGLIDATPGLQVAATVGSTADAVAIGPFVGASVAVVDVDAGDADEDFTTIGELAEHLTIVAIGDAAAGGIRACGPEPSPSATRTATPTPSPRRSRRLSEPRRVRAHPPRGRHANRAAQGDVGKRVARDNRPTTP